MTTRSQAQKMASQASQSQRRSSVDKSKHVDMSQLILDKIDSLSNKFTTQFIDFKKEVRHEIRSDLKEINQKVDVLLGEMKNIKKRVEILEYTSERSERQITKMENNREQDLDEMAAIEQKIREKAIKIRGLTEERNENLSQRLLPKMSEFLEKTTQEMYAEIDTLFRVNSVVAKQRGLPRDVVVNFVRKNVRDSFLAKHNQDPFIIEGQSLRILKDVPGRLLKKRRNYSNLTAFLRREKIQYRWETPEGLTFWWGRKRVRISTVDQATDFLKQVFGNKMRRNKDKKKDQKPEDEDIDEEVNDDNGIVEKQKDIQKYRLKVTSSAIGTVPKEFESRGDRGDLPRGEEDNEDGDDDDDDEEEEGVDEEEENEETLQSVAGIEDFRGGIEEFGKTDNYCLSLPSPIGVEEYFDD